MIFYAQQSFTWRSIKQAVQRGEGGGRALELKSLPLNKKILSTCPNSSVQIPGGKSPRTNWCVCKTRLFVLFWHYQIRYLSSWILGRLQKDNQIVKVAMMERWDFFSLVKTITPRQSYNIGLMWLIFFGAFVGEYSSDIFPSCSFIAFYVDPPDP